jgi:hypothetical protein
MIIPGVSLLPWALRRAWRASETRAGEALETTLQPICELAEDQSPWRRLQRVIADGR